MRRYHRAYVAGACYFFTLALAQRRGNRLLIEHIDALRAAHRLVRARHPFRIDAMVVLPDHLHAVWTLPDDSADFSLRWSLIKAGFSRQIARSEAVSQSRRQKGERGLWQRRFWEHLIRDPDDYARHVDYIHYNPVKHGLVAQAVDWPHSSIHRFVRDGILPADWASSPETARLDFE
ncbi:MAG: transposase [Lysobacterales bacterium]